MENASAASTQQGQDAPRRPDCIVRHARIFDSALHGNGEGLTGDSRNARREACGQALDRIGCSRTAPSAVSADPQTGTASGDETGLVERLRAKKESGGYRLSGATRKGQSQ
jgi:hypothetical protein